MGFLSDLLGNEVSHVGDLFSNFSGKNAEQLALGAADPLSAKLWGGVTGQNFTPMVGQLGGETGAQYAQSQAQGVNTAPAQFMGQIANTVAGAEAGSYFGGGGSLLSTGSNDLSGTTPVSSTSGTSLAPLSIPDYSSAQGGYVPLMTQPVPQASPQQKLAAALMQPQAPNQSQIGSSPLGRVAQISNQSLAMHMMQGGGQ